MNANKTATKLIDVPENLPDNSKYAPKYIPIESIIELHERKLSSCQIGKLLDCSGSAVRSRLQKLGKVVNHSENYRKNRAAVLDVAQQIIMSEIAGGSYTIATPRDLKDASIAYRNMYECGRLEDGKSTVNVSSERITKAVIEIDAEIAELQARLEQKVDSEQGIEQSTQVIDITDDSKLGETGIPPKVPPKRRMITASTTSKRTTGKKLAVKRRTVKKPVKRVKRDPGQPEGEGRV